MEKKLKSSSLSEDKVGMDCTGLGPDGEWQKLYCPFKIIGIDTK